MNYQPAIVCWSRCERFILVSWWDGDQWHKPEDDKIQAHGWVWSVGTLNLTPLHKVESLS